MPIAQTQAESKENQKFPANNHDVELAQRIMGFGVN